MYDRPSHAILERHLDVIPCKMPLCALVQSVAPCNDCSVYPIHAAKIVASERPHVVSVTVHIIWSAFSLVHGAGAGACP